MLPRGGQAWQHAVADALRDEEGVALAFLFGSAARGADTERSDLDVAVLGHELDVLSLQSLLSARLGREVDIVLVASAGIPLLREILRDGLVVREAKRGAAAMFRSHALTTLETDGPWFARMRDAWIARVARQGVHW